MILVLSFFVTQTRIWSKVPVMFKWITQALQPVVPSTTRRTTAKTNTPAQHAQSEFAAGLLQNFGRIVAISFFGGLVWGYCDYKSKNRRALRNENGQCRRNCLQAVEEAFSSFVATSVQLGERILTAFVVAVIVSGEVTAVLAIRSIFFSKNLLFLLKRK